MKSQLAASESSEDRTFVMGIDVELYNSVTGSIYSMLRKPNTISDEFVDSHFFSVAHNGIRVPSNTYVAVKIFTYNKIAEVSI